VSPRNYQEADDHGLITDEDGKPLVLYRGQHGSKSIQTRLPSISFGTESAALIYSNSPNDRIKDTVAKNPSVLRAHLKIKKPVLNDSEDPFMDLSVLIGAVGDKVARAAAIRHADHIENTNNWDDISSETRIDFVEQFLEKHPGRLADLYLNAFPLFDDPEVIDALKEASFDGAIYGGVGDNALEVEYRVFDKDQIVVVSS